MMHDWIQIQSSLDSSNFNWVKNYSIYIYFRVTNIALSVNEYPLGTKKKNRVIEVWVIETQLYFNTYILN